MDFRFTTPELRSLDEVGAELLACCAWRDERPMRGLVGLLDWRLAGRLSGLSRETFLVGELGEVLCVPGRPRLPFDKVLVLGLGERAAFDEAAFKTALSRLLASLEGLHVKRAVVELPGRADDVISPERACELVLAAAGDSEAHDAWWLVESPEGQRRITQRTQDERRRSRTG